MRSRTLLALGILLAVGCLIFLRQAPPAQQKSVADQAVATASGQNQSPSPPRAPRVGQPEQRAVDAGGQQRSRQLSLDSPAPNLQPPVLTPEQSNVLNERIVADWQGPIEFYGKVVDENSKAVAGADIAFHWVETPDETGNRSANTQSDANGLFSLHGRRGLSLGVSVSKGGYYSSRRDNDTFNYGPLNGPPFLADPQNPVIFHLRKKGKAVELVTSENGMRPSLAVRVPKDGSPIRLDLFSKRPSQSGQLEVSQNKPPWKEAAEWSFRMTLLDGGFLDHQDEFQFEAPESGYRPTVEYHFAKSDTNWITHATMNWYVAFGKPRKYGWLRIESDLAQETVFITYAINPDGSRNLEPAK